MSFSVRLESDQVIVEPGVNTPLSIEVANRGDEKDRYEIQIEGLDPQWTAVPVPVFEISPHEIQTEKVFFKPPRDSESLAGNYPFVIKIRSLESGETRTAQGILQIKPYHHLSMEVIPKRGTISMVRKHNVFHATIVNLGNVEHTVQLFGSDPEDACAYEFTQEQVTVGPGQQKEVEVEAIPTKTRPFASPRLHVFTLSARSVETPSIVATAQGQLEQKPVISPGALAIFLMALGLLVVWIALLPKKPQVDRLTLSRTQAVRGEQVTIGWSASHAKSVELRFNDQLLTTGEPEGSFTFTPERSGTVSAIAIADSRTSPPMNATLEVLEPEKPPEPRILSFDITPRSVNRGSPVIVKYKVENATKVTLAPVGIVLDPNIESQQITPAIADEYYLVVEGAAGNAESRKIRISLTDESEVRIVVFRASPKEVDPTFGEVTITWQLTEAVRAELMINGERTELQDVKGEMNVTIGEDTTFKLIGYDKDGRVRESEPIKVTIKQPPPPDTTGTGTSTTGGGTGTSTTTGTTGGG